MFFFKKKKGKRKKEKARAILPADSEEVAACVL